jgi:hypothetical protein
LRRYNELVQQCTEEGVDVSDVVDADVAEARLALLTTLFWPKHQTDFANRQRPYRTELRRPKHHRR